MRNMVSAVDETQTKELFKQAVVELLQERRAEFYELFIEALEDVGLANAIREGRRNEFVSETYINAILTE